jgi:arylsulfatase A-like enzyme
MRDLAAALFLLLALPAPGGAQAPERPSLLVLVSVDGLSWRRLEAYRPYYREGLKRLLDEGQIEAEARYRHMNTETGPGHAALSTGAPPRVTGIVANGWFEKNPKGAYASRYCVDEWRPSGTVAGAQALRVPTLGDRLLEAHPESRIVSLSAKDRAAILMAGHAPRGDVYWWDQVTGAFVTSVAFPGTPEGGAIVATANKRGAGPGRFGLFWKPLPLPASDVVLPQPAPDLLEYQVPANGLAFPHSFSFSSRGYFPSLYVSPFPDELVADLAVAFLEDKAYALGRKATPDVLALSFSSQDVVSHTYGNESEENLDVLRRLDIQLGRVFKAFDAAGLSGRVALGLSADHGFPDIPEARRARDPKFLGGRLVEGGRSSFSLSERLNALLARDLCLAPGSRPILGIEGWTVAYDRGALPLKTVAGACGPAGSPVGAKELDPALVKAVAHCYPSEIAEVLLTADEKAWPSGDKAVEFARNDFDPERSGDALLIPRENYMLTSDAARGASHGSLYEYDIHVPLVFWGASFPKQRVETPATPYDLAPTLGATVGLTLKDAVGTSRKAP